MHTADVREQMIEQQVRAWDVLDGRVLEVMRRVPRELFVPPEQRYRAYADVEVPLARGQHMLRPSVAGRLLQALLPEAGTDIKGHMRSQQELLDAQLQLKGAQADFINTRAMVQSDLMDQKAAGATVGADYTQAQLQARTDKSLYDLGVISGLTYSASKGKADELTTRNDLEKQRLTLNEKAIETQLAVQQTKVEQAKALLALKQREQDALSVRAGISGVLVELDHQVGEHVDVGTTLAKVVQPDQLKASLKIAETQARDIQIGQPAEIDTHNGVIDGKVMRIDPGVLNGTVTVDVELAGALPLGARPDLSVDGTIDLDRMADVLFVGRPAFGNENSTISLFKLTADGKTAVRVPVKVGRASVNSIQVIEGLQSGDTVILSDMSRWDNTDKIRLE